MALRGDRWLQVSEHRTGDGGTTRLGDFSETTKTDLRLAAYADVDETNAQLGVAIALGELPDDVVTVDIATLKSGERVRVKIARSSIASARSKHVRDIS